MNRQSKKISVFSGTKEEVINGQTVTVKQYTQIDLDKQLDYDRLINEVMSTDPEQNKKAKEELAVYRVLQLVGEAERKRLEEEDGI